MQNLRRYKWTLIYVAVILTLVLIMQILDVLDWPN